MKKIINILLSILLIISYGCYKDKGNYSYKDINDVKIKGIEEKYVSYIGDTLEINPEIDFTIEENQNLSYLWTVEGDTISQEKDLKWEVSKATNPRYFCDFSVINEDNGVKRTIVFELNVSSHFKSGWVILSDKGEYSQLNYLSSDNKFYQDIYYNYNGEHLGSKPIRIREHFIPWSADIGQLQVICQGGNKSVEVDGASFNKVVFCKDEFAGGIPTDFNPSNSASAPNYDYIISNGKLFTRNIPGDSWRQKFNMELYANEPLAGTYELNDVIIRDNLVFGGKFLTYDKIKSRYLILNSGKLQELSFTHDTVYAFPKENMNKELISGEAIASNWAGAKFLTILKGLTNNSIYIHNFTYSYGRLFTHFEIATNLHELIDENTQFVMCQKRPYIYFNSGNKLYQINYKDIIDEVKDNYTYEQWSNAQIETTIQPKLIKEFNSKIIQLEINKVTYAELAVATESASGANLSDFYLLDVSVPNIPIIHEELSKCGKVVDIRFKIGNSINTMN